MKKIALGLAAAAVIASPLATTATATAAPSTPAPASATVLDAASTTVQYTGQGLTNGVLNTDIGGEQGLLLWVFNAKGATTATINLPDGTSHPMTTSGNGFKFESKYWAPADLARVTVTYTGPIAKNPTLTVSHGHAVDTNIPANTWTTADGGTVPGDFGDSPVFRYKAVQDRNYSWQSSLGNLFTSVQHVVQTDMRVDAEPIRGDVTGNIVGYTLTKPIIEYTTDASGNQVPVKTSSTTRSGVDEGTCPDGGTFVKWVMWNPATDPSTATDTPYGMKLPFTNNIKSGLAVDGEWLTTL